jgi:hypothetical protein
MPKLRDSEKTSEKKKRKPVRRKRLVRFANSVPISQSVAVHLTTPSRRREKQTPKVVSRSNQPNIYRDQGVGIQYQRPVVIPGLHEDVVYTGNQQFRIPRYAANIPVMTYMGPPPQPPAPVVQTQARIPQAHARRAQVNSEVPERPVMEELPAIPRDVRVQTGSPVPQANPPKYFRPISPPKLDERSRRTPIHARVLPYGTRARAASPPESTIPRYNRSIISEPEADEESSPEGEELAPESEPPTTASAHAASQHEEMEEEPQEQEFREEPVEQSYEQESEEPEIVRREGHVRPFQVLGRTYTSMEDVNTNFDPMAHARYGRGNMTIGLFGGRLGSMVQSVIFEKNKWTPEQAKIWVLRSGLRAMKQPHLEGSHWRIRIKDPREFKRFITKKLDHGIDLVIGFPS